MDNKRRLGSEAKQSFAAVRSQRESLGINQPAPGRLGQLALNLYL